MLGLLIQEVKTLFKSPASISILVIPLVLLVGLGYLLPSGWIVPSSITIGIVGAVLLYFGGSLEEIKRTSFMKSISLTKLSKFSFLATKILFSIFVSMIAVLWVLFFSWVFTSVDAISFLATDFGNLLPADQGGVTDVLRILPFDIDWTRVQWFQMLYAGMMTIVIAVSLSFIFVAFAKSSLSFYLMSFGYLLAMILFGGVVMPGFLISSDNSWFKSLYYLIPNYYTNNVMAYSFSGGVLPSAVSSIGNMLAAVSKSDLATIIGNLDFNHLLFGDVFANIDFSTFTQAEKDTVMKILFGTDMKFGVGSFAKADWNGSISQFIERYNKYTSTANLDLFRDAILAPLYNNNVQSYSELFINQLSSLLNSLIVSLNNIEHTVGSIDFEDAISKLKLIDSLLNSTPSIVIDPLIWNGVGPWIGLGNLLFGNIDFIADPSAATGVVNTTEIIANIESHLPAYLPIIQWAVTHLEVIGKVVMEIIPMILPDQLAATVQDMFAKPDAYNYVVPWIETAFFLVIAVIFFKWS